MREVSKRRPLVCAEGLEMQSCAFCFSTERVASICVNKEQRKLTLRANTVEEKRAEQVLASQKKKKIDAISASAQLCLHFPIQIMKKGANVQQKGERGETFWGLYQPGQPHDLWELNLIFMWWEVCLGL